MSLSLYERMKNLYASLQSGKTVDLKITPDVLRKIKIPESLVVLSKEQGLTYDELVNFILTEFNNRMTKDIRMYTRDIINTIKTYPGISEEAKKGLLIHILKEMEK